MRQVSAGLLVIGLGCAGFPLAREASMAGLRTGDMALTMLW
jgi:glycerol-3-phosphate dehydrogenase